MSTHPLRLLSVSLAGLLCFGTGCDLFDDSDGDRPTPALVEGVIDLDLFEGVPLGEIHLFAHRIEADGASSEILGLFTVPDEDGRYRLEVPVPEGEAVDVVVKSTREGRNPQTGATIRVRALVSGPLAAGTSAPAARLDVPGTGTAQVYLAARQMLAQDTTRAAGLARGLTPASVAPWVDGILASSLGLGNEDDVALARCRCRAGLHAEAVLAGLEAFEAALRSPVVGASTDVLEALSAARSERRRALDAFIGSTLRGAHDAGLAAELDVEAFESVNLGARERAFAFHAAAAAIRAKAEERNFLDDEEKRRLQVDRVVALRLSEAVHQADRRDLFALLSLDRSDEAVRAAQQEARRVLIPRLDAAAEDLRGASSTPAAWHAYGETLIALLDTAVESTAPWTGRAAGSSVRVAARCQEVWSPGWPAVLPEPLGEDEEADPAVTPASLAAALTAASALVDADVQLATLDAADRTLVTELVGGTLMWAFPEEAVSRATVAGRVLDAEGPVWLQARVGAGEWDAPRSASPTTASDEAGVFSASVCFAEDSLGDLLVVALDPSDGQALSHGLVPGPVAAGETIAMAPLDAQSDQTAVLLQLALEESGWPSLLHAAGALHLAHPAIATEIMDASPATLRLHARALAAHLETRAALFAGLDADDGTCCVDPERLAELMAAESYAWREDGAARDALAAEGTWPLDPASETDLRAAVDDSVADALEAAGIFARAHALAEIAGAFQRLTEPAFGDLRHPVTYVARSVVHRDLAARNVRVHAEALATFEAEPDAAVTAALFSDIDESLGDGTALRTAWARYETGLFDQLADALEATSEGMGAAFIDLSEDFTGDALALAAALDAARDDRAAIADAYTSLVDTVTGRVEGALVDVDAEAQAAVVDAVVPLLAMRAFDARAMP